MAELCHRERKRASNYRKPKRHEGNRGSACTSRRLIQERHTQRAIRGEPPARSPTESAGRGTGHVARTRHSSRPSADAVAKAVAVGMHGAQSRADRRQHAFEKESERLGSRRHAKVQIHPRLPRLYIHTPLTYRATAPPPPPTHTSSLARSLKTEEKKKTPKWYLLKENMRHAVKRAKRHRADPINSIHRAPRVLPISQCSLWRVVPTLAGRVSCNIRSQKRRARSGGRSRTDREGVASS